MREPAESHGDQGPKVEVSVVMPCLNEARTIKTCILKAQAAIKEHQLDAEIILADNGSTDGSDRIAIECGARVVHVEDRGYGAALMGGIASAKGTYVVMGDADDSYDFLAIQPFIEKLRQGYDLVMGCRFPRGGGSIVPGAMPWKHRWLGTPVLTFLSRLFFGSPITDINCGLRAFRRDCYDTLELRTTGMEFAAEMVIKAALHNARIAEVPITLYKDGRGRPPHLRSWRDGWRMLRFMLLYSPSWLFFAPGCLLFVLGMIGMVVLLPGAQTIGGVNFDTNTLLVSVMALLVGFKLMAFWIFAKVYAVANGLLPAEPISERVANILRLEIGIVAGLGMIVIGLAFLIWGVLFWKRYEFGTLSYPESLRIVIPGVTGIVLGLELVFSSFFLSVLKLPHR